MSRIGAAIAARLSEAGAQVVTADLRDADVVASCLGPAGRTITGDPLAMDQGWTAR